MNVHIITFKHFRVFHACKDLILCSYHRIVIIEFIITLIIVSRKKIKGELLVFALIV